MPRLNENIFHMERETIRWIFLTDRPAQINNQLCILQRRTGWQSGNIWNLFFI